MCVCMSGFSMGFPLFCPCLKAPFSVICCVSCSLCLPLFSSAHPITVQWLIACLASKSQCAGVCVCQRERKKGDWEEILCVYVHLFLSKDLRFSSYSKWPRMHPCLLSDHGHTGNVTKKTTQNKTKDEKVGIIKSGGNVAKCLQHLPVHFHCQVHTFMMCVLGASRCKHNLF